MIHSLSTKNKQNQISFNKDKEKQDRKVRVSYLYSLSQKRTGLTYELMKMALPRNGFNGVENTAETMAWTNNMAESGMGGVEIKLPTLWAVKHIKAKT